MDSVPVPLARPAGWRSRFLPGLGRKLAELVTVFAGVYAAFLLNAYQVHQQERQRRGQILDWLDQNYSESDVAIKQTAAEIKRDAEEFNRQVQAGAMPRLHVFNWRSDYDPSDVSGLLQGGGFDLLEVATIHSLKDMDGTLRQIVGVLRHDQQLSDTLVLPNIDDDPAMFYDPTTKQLLRKYGWYTDYFETVGNLFDELQRQNKTLLAQIHAERARNR